jgi:hypothetical protein
VRVVHEPARERLTEKASAAGDHDLHDGYCTASDELAPAEWPVSLGLKAQGSTD